MNSWIMYSSQKVDKMLDPLQLSHNLRNCIKKKVPEIYADQVNGAAHESPGHNCFANLDSLYDLHLSA